MANKGKIEEIQEEALKILGDNPKGLEYGQLHKKIAALPAGYNPNTIAFAILALPKQFPDKVVKPEAGWYQLRKDADKEAGWYQLRKDADKEAGWYQLRKDADKEAEVPSEDTPEQPAKKRANEKAFYEYFASQLQGALDECTRAISLSGVNIRGKWLTPDVFGTYQFPKDLGFQAQPPRIVSAEIKASDLDRDVLTGFGQACAYKIFSHKVYLVIPESARIAPRISALCSQFGIGLVLFNSQNPNDPNWTLRNSATVSEPHYFYVAQVVKHVKDGLTDELINELF